MILPRRNLPAMDSANVVRARLQGMIEMGGLPSDGRLPTERELSDSMGVGRRAARPAEPCCKACDQFFAKVMSRIVSQGIANVIAGNQEDVHVGNGFQKGDPRPKSHPTQDRKTPRIRSQIQVLC